MLPRWARERERAKLLTKLPVLRRYDAEIRRLKSELAAAAREAARLHAAQPDPDWLAGARRYEYLWSTAFKKVDIRDVEPFGSLAARIVQDGRTYLNVDRLYTLWQMASGLPAGARAVAEVGVYKGGSARFVAETLRLHGREVPFFVCDTFAGHAEVDEAIDRRHRVGEQFVHVKFDKVKEYLAPFPFIRIVKGNIRETAGQFAGEQFGLVHVDVDVYPVTRFCLEFFAPRLVVGGAIVVDDYGSRKCQGVAMAVDEFVAASRDVVSIHLLSGQAVIVRVEATRRSG